MAEYRQRTMTSLAPDRGWEPVDLDALPAGRRENLLWSREHLVEQRRGGQWHKFSYWAQDPSELAARREVDRLKGQAEVVRMKAVSPVQGAKARLAMALAALEDGKRGVSEAEDALKAAQVVARESEDEAKAIDRQVKEAQKELDSILASQRREPAAV
jgi:hypothetical protein